ncbi:Serine/threonine-protein kinase PknB [Rosistilla ulvae]|uniref:non-specific serine/threonine protein kinase n=1 Tax=Rosistilla ulvae TaxID=1930277 RepID=A0A517M173_9BACT|nr:serine/threonine-protein kinase [Rosistilla ulvae]QDS88569.1 Serine/threonine-protein kinase PknB [Rosistilla ulvae]
MSNESPIDELLEELLESHRSVEEVCADHPELIREVRSRFQKIRSVESQIDQLFPPSVTPAHLVDARTAVQNAALPEIPGYDVDSVLGHGGMGVVYHARHLQLNRTVAIKTLLAGSYATDVERLRFAREAEAIAGLRHPHIVQIYDVGEVAGRPFYTMELVEGGTLSQKLAANPVSVREAAETAAVLSRAVQAAHEGGIVHRDLKPANILLTDDQTPKISDFGLARRFDGEADLTLTGARMGTPSYMAPEQATGEFVGPAVDIYALGTLLYEMLTGQPPFRDESIIETERRLISEDPIPPSNSNHNVPRDLETICLKCLEKEPHQRYLSAADLADDLQRFLRYEPIAARPISRTARGWRWVRRSPSTAALIVTAVALFGLLAAYGTRELALASGSRAEKARLTARLESGLELGRQGRYAESLALLGKLGDGGHVDLRQRIDQAITNLDFIEELASLSLNRFAVIDGRYDRAHNQAVADQRYEAIFEELGMGSVHDDPTGVANRVKGSEAKLPLIAALDDWAVCANAGDRRNWVLAVARAADPDSTGLRNRIRDPEKWLDAAVLSDLSQQALEANLSVQLLCVLGDRCDEAGLDAVAFRKQVQRAHTNDFLANFALADELSEREPSEAIRYYQAALAVRPHASPAHNNLGMALAKLGRTDEAVEFFQSALQINPKFVLAHYNLGQTLATTGKPREAIDQFQEAIEVDANDAFGRYQLGLALRGTGELQRAVESFRQAIQIDPRYGAAYGALGETLLEMQHNEQGERALLNCLQLLPQNDPLRPRVQKLLENCCDS